MKIGFRKKARHHHEISPKNSPQRDGSKLNKKPAGKGRHALRWVLSGFMLLNAIAFFPSWASVLMITFAVACSPITAVETYLTDKLHITGHLKSALLALLFVVSVIAAPTQDAQYTVPSSEGQVGSQSSQAIAASSSADFESSASVDTSATAAQSGVPVQDNLPPAVSYEIDSTAVSSGQAQIPASTPASDPEPAPEPAPEPKEQMVYVTPTGKRYHYNSNCGNGSYSQTTLSNAKSMGLTPCKKCAGG